MGILVQIYRPHGHAGMSLSDAAEWLCVTNIAGPFTPSENKPGFRLIEHDYYPRIPMLVPSDMQPFAGLGGPMAGSNVACGMGRDWDEAVRRIICKLFESLVIKLAGVVLSHPKNESFLNGQGNINV
jgi:hypothetical protein